MSAWEQAFASQMETLRARTGERFEQAVRETIEPAFESMSSFVNQWQFQSSTPQTGEHRRNFKFALTEDCYVIVGWRFEGMDTLEFDYEYCVPVTGRVEGERASASLRGLERAWVESCFQRALGAFAKHLVATEVSEGAAEAMLV